MNIKILDSWLREYLETDAKPEKIGELLSLSSASVERIEKFGTDAVYDIEVTTNRPDLMSVVGLAKETAAVLTQSGIKARFIEKKPKEYKPQGNLVIDIKNDPKLVNRVCAAVLEISIKDSPKFIKDRLEASGIRTLNNLIDVTNYIMRELGHPAHVFDYDRLTSKKLIVREARKGEQLETLDHKIHELQGGDIVADNGEGEIVDLLGVMGTANSVVTNQTKRVLLFLDNNEPTHIRKTSMALGIRSEAAVLNEKGIDSELALPTLLRGIELYHEIADAKLVSPIIDIYPNKPKTKSLTVSMEKINTVIGVSIPLKTSVDILNSLGFQAKSSETSIQVIIPTNRLEDVSIEEDIIEEVARIYGYHKLPSILPPVQPAISHPFASEFYWEQRTKETLKYFGFTETYTYSFVSEDLYEGPTDNAVELSNPLSTDFVYMRKTLVPSLLQVVAENKNYSSIKIFELSNVYHQKNRDLPDEVRMLAGVVKKDQTNFFEVKGVIEQILADLGIPTVSFKLSKDAGLGTDIYIGSEKIGKIEVLDETLINFELNFELVLAHVTRKKVYTPLSKYPPVIEDISIVISEDVSTGDIIELIKKSVRQDQDKVTVEVSLLDKFENTRTFHVLYLHKEKNLTTSEVGEIREKIHKALKEKFHAEIK